jgi:quinol monooxygenase YgiN
MDLNSAPTGNTCFVLTEIYESKAGVLDHFEQTMRQWTEKCKITFVSEASIINSLW